ncbi:hypothetical protein ACIHCQ_35070 [Streptomyces sp. NPDC052236]|uniref:hypothetical protein n=1 Tax=Streptomyces sp. NPDC052236 TaxID=3365686 RepID=UPI0037D3C828
MGELETLGEDLSPEAAELARELRVLHSALGISVRRYASRCYVDAGAVSRFLSGKRVPPWPFVMGLLTEVAEHRGEPATPETIAHLRRLHRKAITASSATGRVRELQHLLEETDAQVRQYQAREQSTAELLQDRQHRLQQLRLQLRAVEGARAVDREEQETVLAEQQRAQDRLRAERDQLQWQVTRLSEQLTHARRATVLAEERCTLLERQLDAAEEANRRGEGEQARRGHHVPESRQANAERASTSRETGGSAPERKRLGSKGSLPGDVAELEALARVAGQSGRPERPQTTARSSTIPGSGITGEISPGEQESTADRTFRRRLRLPRPHRDMNGVAYAAAMVAVGAVIGLLTYLRVTSDVSYGILYHAGDKPSERRMSCSGLYGMRCTGMDGWYWRLSAGGKTRTILAPEDAKNRLLLSGDLELADSSTDCARARVAWQITTTDPAATLIASGTLQGDSEQRSLTESLPRSADRVELRAERIDRESCDADLRWNTPGLSRLPVS